MLSYLIKLNLRNEYIKITQEGFKFREKLFASFNELVAWFKLHFNDPLPVPAMRPPPIPTQNSNISSQMSGMSLTPQHSSSSSNNNNPNRTPSYPSSSSIQTPQHSSSNAFDSIINNSSQSNHVDYSTSSQDINNSYSGPNKYNEYRGGSSGKLYIYYSFLFSIF